MSVSDEVMPGRFWRVGTPLPERCGELRVRAGRGVKLRVEGPISPSRMIRVESVESLGMQVVRYSADPDDAVADFQPVTVHGVLDDGTELTVVDAQAYNDGFLQQWFRAPVVVMDAHLGGQGQRYAAVSAMRRCGSVSTIHAGGLTWSSLRGGRVAARSARCVCGPMRMRGCGSNIEHIVR